MSDLLDRLKKFYKIDTKKNNGNSQIIPLQNKSDNTDKLVPVKFNSEIERMFKFYLDKCTINQEDIQKRNTRNKLLKTMEMENTLIFLAVEMLSDEAIQTQDSSNIINVKSKSTRLKNKIQELLNNWHINQNVLKPFFRSLFLFGDAFRFRKITKNGIEGFIWLDVDDIQRRIEFNPLRADEYLENKSSINFTNMIKKYHSLQDLVNAIDNEDYDSLGSMFDSFLLGWELTNGQILPPWSISHSKLYTTESDFYPYGRSLFINSLSAFLQLKASKNLMIMARANNFPIEIYEIWNNENQTETEKWNALNRFIQNYNNITSTQTLAEQKGIKSSVYTMDGLFKYRVEKPDFNLDQIADIEMLELDLMRPTGIPLDLILGRGSNYSSGKLLSTQSVFFSRKITAGHSALLESLIEDIKLHLYLINDIDKDEDFELEMFAPQSEKAEEYFNTRKNTLELVNNIISNIKTACGIEANVLLPKNVIINILSNYSFLSKDEVTDIVNALYDAVEKTSDLLGGDDAFVNLNNDLNLDKQNIENDNIDDTNIDIEKVEKKKLNEIYKLGFIKKMTESDKEKLSRITKTILNESYFETKKQMNFTEGIQGYRYFMSSNYRSSQLDNSLYIIKKYIEKDLKIKNKI